MVDRPGLRRVNAPLRNGRLARDLRCASELDSVPRSLRAGLRLVAEQLSARSAGASEEELALGALLRGLFAEDDGAVEAAAAAVAWCLKASGQRYPRRRRR